MMTYVYLLTVPADPTRGGQSEQRAFDDPVEASSFAMSRRLYPFTVCRVEFVTASSDPSNSNKT